MIDDLSGFVNSEVAFSPSVLPSVDFSVSFLLLCVLGDVSEDFVSLM